MTFLAPWFLAAGAAAALAVVVVHLLALQRPPVAPLPTARFVPDLPARAASRANRPTDRWLLALRVLAVLLLAAAFARPVPTPQRAALRRVLLVDRSRAVGDAAALRDSALARFRPGDAIILFDSAAHVVPAPDADSLRTLRVSVARGSLSAAFVAALRTATALRDSTDSVALAVISPLAAELRDAATPALRALWPGALELVRVPAATDSGAPRAIDVRAPTDDPLAVAAGFLGGAAVRWPVRIVRTAPQADDSAWVRSTGGVLVVWPDSAAPPGWRARPVDTVGAVTAAGATLVAPFVRAARAPHDGVVRARWVDGEAAAVETPLGEGCVRAVAVPTAHGGDLALRPAFRELVRVLAAPCGGPRMLDPLDERALAALRGVGAPAVALERDAARRSPLVPWLLGAALAALLAELALRRLGGPA
ncbi:MAG TPA: BatA domain-containing protein [Gemmatimonadaceae bacterium]|nr:BatA domain-containing protein [Gemmatimonadaceae bacterium]